MSKAFRYWSDRNQIDEQHTWAWESGESAKIESFRDRPTTKHRRRTLTCKWYAICTCTWTQAWPIWRLWEGNYAWKLYVIGMWLANGWMPELFNFLGGKQVRTRACYKCSCVQQEARKGRQTDKEDSIFQSERISRLLADSNSHTPAPILIRVLCRCFASVWPI